MALSCPVWSLQSQGHSTLSAGLSVAIAAIRTHQAFLNLGELLVLIESKCLLLGLKNSTPDDGIGVGSGHGGRPWSMAAISSPTAKSGQSVHGPVSAGPEGAPISAVRDRGPSSRKPPFAALCPKVPTERTADICYACRLTGVEGKEPSLAADMKSCLKEPRFRSLSTKIVFTEDLTV